MHNGNKLQAPFERLKKYDLSPDIALRNAIIMRAIFDATSASKDRKAIKAKYEAQTWLLSGCDDFKQICFEADLCPKLVMQIAKEEIMLSAKRSEIKNSGKNVYTTKRKEYSEIKCALL